MFTLRSIRSSMLLVALVGMVLVPRLASAEGLSDIQKYQVRLAINIIKNLGDKNLTPRKRYEMVFAPIVKANEMEMKRNRKRVQSFLSKAKELREDNPDRAKQYMRLAKAYKAYADANLAIIEAYKDDQGGDVDEAIARLLKIEKEIEKVTGKKVDREWFTPAEAEGLAFNELAKRKAGNNGQ